MIVIILYFFRCINSRIIYIIPSAWHYVGWKLWGKRGKGSEEEWARVLILILLYVLSWPRSPCFYILLYTWMTSLLILLSLTIPSFKIHLIFPTLFLSSPHLPRSLLLYLTNKPKTILIKIIQSFSPNLYNPLIINTKTRFHIMYMSTTTNSNSLCCIDILLFTMIWRWRWR